MTLAPDLLEDYSGVKKFKYGLAEETNQIGQVTGLAWTQVGGELLTIECALTPGKGGRVVKTGSLGDVMQESIQTALTVVRSRAPAWVWRMISTKNTIFTCTYQRGGQPPRKMARVPVLACVQHWFLH